MGRSTATPLLLLLLTIVLLLSVEHVTSFKTQLKCGGVNGSFILQATKLTLQPGNKVLFPAADPQWSSCKAEANHFSSAELALTTKNVSGSLPEIFVLKMTFEQVESTDGGVPRWVCSEMSFSDNRPFPETDLKSLGWSFNSTGYSCSRVTIPFGPKQVENLRVVPHSEHPSKLAEKGGYEGM